MYPGVEKAVLLKPSFCPLRCGAQVTGKQHDLHVNHECPRRQAHCPHGCGDRVLGSELDGHCASCPMRVFLDRGDVAVRENALRELNLALEGVYQEKERARARILSRGEKDVGKKGWATGKCESRVKKLEAAAQDLRTRLRRRAKEKLIGAIVAQGVSGSTASGVEEKNGPASAMKYWDAFDSDLAPRGSRPWDMDTPELQFLMEAVDEAAVCGADEKLRRRAEAMLLAAVRRLLEACLAPMDDDPKVVMADVVERTRAAARLVELESLGDIPELLHRVHTEMHRSILRELKSAPEFHQAVVNGDVELCRWFFDRERANPSEPFPDSWLPPLVVAVKAGDIPMCRLLIERSADIDARCPSDGLSALHWAAHQRSARTVAVLLAGRANPRLQCLRGQDALMKLVRRDFDRAAEGCTWVWQLQRGRLPGPWLPGSGTMDLESAKVAGENDLDCVGFSFCSAGIGDSPTGRVCISLRAAVGNQEALNRQRAAASSSEFPPFEEADELEDANEESLWTSYLKVETDPAHDVRMLLVNGADAMAADAGGLTALHHHLLLAPSRGSVGAVEVLVKGGADVNRRDHSERFTTPLLLAVSARRADLVRVMLKDAWPPADVDSKAADGTSALAMAESLGAREVAALLRDAGASAWAEAEVRLGARTTFTFDTRVRPVPA